MRRILRRGLVIALVVAALAALGWYVYGQVARAAYEDRVAALRAAGEPTRFEDLAPPPVPDEENGAKLLGEAHRLLEERRSAPDNAEGNLYEAQSGLELDADEWRALRAYLDSLSPYFDLLARASERETLRFDLDWGRGGAMPVEYLAWLRDAGSYLVARVRFDPEDAGHADRAARAAVVLIDLGRKSRGAFLVGHLLPGSLASRDPCEVLRHAMRRKGFDAASFRRALDPALVRATPTHVPPRRAFVEERVFGIGFIEAMGKGATRDFVGGDWLTGAEDRLSFWRAPIGYRDASRYLDIVGRAIAASETTPERAASVDLPEPEGPYYPVTKALGLAYERVFTKFVEAVAVQRLARVVMALLEYRQREASWPAGLAALGEMPVDPFGGEPFLYERTGRGCRVRSRRALGQPDDLAEDDFLLWILDDDQMPAMAR